VTDPAWPPVPDGQYELRSTRAAMGDLGVPGRVAAGDLDAVAATTRWPAIVEKFREQRALDPGGTEGPMHSVGRGDVFSLHGPDGQRACTWYDRDAGVVWLLAFTAEHDYVLFEDRAKDGALLPTEDDYVELVVFRQEREFEEVVAPGVRELVTSAVNSGAPARGSIGGGLLRLEVVAEVVRVDGVGIGDVYLSVALPLDDARNDLRDWPGADLLQRLADATGLAGTLDYPSKVPDSMGTRPVRRDEELVVALRDVVLA